MTSRLSGHFSIFGLVFFVLKSLLGIARQWRVKKCAILTLKPRSHLRILYIERGLLTPFRVLFPTNKQLVFNCLFTVVWFRT